MRRAYLNFLTYIYTKQALILSFKLRKAIMIQLNWMFYLHTDQDKLHYTSYEELPTSDRPVKKTIKYMSN